MVTVTVASSVAEVMVVVRPEVSVVVPLITSMLVVEMTVLRELPRNSTVLAVVVELLDGVLPRRLRSVFVSHVLQLLHLQQSTRTSKLETQQLGTPRLGC